MFSVFDNYECEGQMSLTDILETKSPNETEKIVYSKNKDLLEKYFSMHSFLDSGLIIFIDESSHFIQLKEIISESLGNSLKCKYPIYTLNAALCTSNSKQFHLTLSNSIGFQNNGNNEYLIRCQLYRWMAMEGKKNWHKNFILMVENAEQLSEKNYQWFIDIENQLFLEDVRFHLILTGNRKLASKRDNFIKKGKEQIVARYLVHELALDE